MTDGKARMPVITGRHVENKSVRKPDGNAKIPDSEIQGTKAGEKMRKQRGGKYGAPSAS